MHFARLVLSLLPSLSACLIAWCILSTCLGPQLTRTLRELWDAAILAGHSNATGPRMAYSRRRRELGLSEQDVDLWEMETYGRAG